jgi:hypothetical protein
MSTLSWSVTRKGDPVSARIARVGAVIRKELAEFRRNQFIVGTAAMLPVIFLIGPTASAAVAAAVRHAPQLPAALVFIPLLAVWAIWVGLGISARVADTRVAQQLSWLASLPPVALAALMSFQVISPTFGLAAALAGGLLAVDCAACLVVAGLFDPERLIAGARPGRGIPAPTETQDIRSPGEATAQWKRELKCR